MASTTYEQKHIFGFVAVFAMCKICTLHVWMSAMVRNAGQLPQPFWLGATCGGCSCSAARCAART